MSRPVDTERRAQELYHAETRSMTGTAWPWVEASDEVKEKYRKRVRLSLKEQL